MKARRFLYTVLTMVCLSIVLMPALRADGPGDGQRKGPNITHDKPHGDGTKHTGPQSHSRADVERMAMAHSLAKYGREVKEPMALIAAAQVLASVKTKPMEMKAETKPDERPREAAEQQGRVDTHRPPDDPVSLLSEARRMAARNAPLSAVVDETARRLKDAPRGRLPGAVAGNGSVPAYSTQTIVWTFEAGEPAAILISGDGDTDLDLYVYDENGNLVASDTDDTDDCLVSWRPRWTGRFTIRIKNLGPVYNEYAIATN